MAIEPLIRRTGRRCSRICMYLMHTYRFVGFYMNQAPLHGHAGGQDPSFATERGNH
jgi:hypothetical protein